MYEKDFFVSYTGTDENYATWVAEVLEKNGRSVVIQAWDFRAGDNFVSKINESLIRCERLIVILSESYLKSKWCEAEWTAKFAEQIKLNERRIIPIRVEPVDIEGLLAQIVYIDIVDKLEDEAGKEILNGILECPRVSIEGYPTYYKSQHLQIDNNYYVYDEEIVYIKTCKTRILSGGNNSIHHRVTWFADESVELIPLNEGMKIEILEMHDTNINYNVVFDKELEKGNEVDYSVKVILSNKNKHFKNFFSSEIITPIDNLDIHLNIENKSIKKVYTQKISNSPMNVRTENPVEHDLVSVFHWHIRKPELNFEYKVYW